MDGGDTAADTTSLDMREDVETIRDTIREIEDRLQEMVNDVTQHSQHIMEQLEAKMDEKIEEIARNADISALVGDHQFGSQTAKTIQTFYENYAQADREIAELPANSRPYVARYVSSGLFHDSTKGQRGCSTNVIPALHLPSAEYW